MRKTKKGGSLFKKIKNITRRKKEKRENHENHEKRDFSFYMCGDDTDDPEEFLKYLSKIPKQKYKLKTIKLEKKQESILNTSEFENNIFTSNNGGRQEFKSEDIQNILVPSFETIHETIHIATSFDPIHAAQAIIFLLLTSIQNIDIIYIHLSPFLGVKKNIKYSDYFKNLKKNLVNYLKKSQEVNVDIYICIQKKEILKLNIKAPNNILPPEINHDPKINDENNLFAKTVRRTEKDALKFIKETNNKDITQVFTSQHSMNQILDKFNTYVDERTRIKMMKKIFKFFIKFKIQNCLFSKLDVTYDSNNILIKQDTQQNGFDRVFCMTNQLNPNIAKIMYQNLHYAFFNIPRTVSSDQKPYIQYINVDDVYTGDIAKGDGGKRSKLYLLPDPNSNYFKKHIKLFFKGQISNRDINQTAVEIMKKDQIHYKNSNNILDQDTLKEVIKTYINSQRNLRIEMISKNETKNLNSYIIDMNEGNKKEINEIYYAIRKRTESSDYYRYAIPLLFLIYGKSL